MSSTGPIGSNATVPKRSGTVSYLCRCLRRLLVLAWKTNSAPHIVHLARGLAVSSRGLAVSSRGLAVSSRGLAVSSRGLAASSRALAVSSRGLAVSSRAPANSVSAEAVVVSFNRKNRQTPDLGRRVTDPAQMGAKNVNIHSSACFVIRIRLGSGYNKVSGSRSRKEKMRSHTQRKYN
jgi:hypothetical protein